MERNISMYWIIFINLVIVQDLGSIHGGKCGRNFSTRSSQSCCETFIPAGWEKDASFAWSFGPTTWDVQQRCEMCYVYVEFIDYA